MGVDKALLGPPGGPLAGRVAGAVVAAGVEEVLLVGGDGDRLSSLGFRWSPDDQPGSGPLGGVATVARVLPDVTLLVCACDLPRVAGTDLAPLVERVGDARNAARADVAVFDVGGVPQWSAIALTPTAHSSARVAYEAGERSLHKALSSPPLRVAHLVPTRPGALRDADRPAELPPELRGTTPRRG